jgi:hypothetical protein
MRHLFDVQRSLTTLVAVAFLLIAQAADAQRPKGTLVANREIGIYAAPRNGLFCKRGSLLGNLKKGTEISSYEELKSFCGLFFRYDYLLVHLTMPDGTVITGYVHRANDDGSDRFELKAKEQ